MVDIIKIENDYILDGYIIYFHMDICANAKFEIILQ